MLRCWQTKEKCVHHEYVLSELIKLLEHASDSERGRWIKWMQENRVIVDLFGDFACSLVATVYLWFLWCGQAEITILHIWRSLGAACGF